MQKLRTGQIVELLGERPGRYIEHDMGSFRMREPDGKDVLEKGAPVEPDATQVDDLVRAGKLTQDGTRYRLPDA